MKILVVGANGQIGKFLCEQLARSEKYSVKAMIRKKEQIAEFKKIGVETVLANLEESVDEIAKSAQSCDAVVFTAGSGGHTGLDKTLLIDLDGAVKTIEAAEQVGIDRFIMVSAYQAHNRKNWSEQIKPYYVAKHYADRILEQSDLNYTIIRPGLLINAEAIERISVAENLEGGSIPREDVARTIVATLSEEQTYRRSFDLISGDTPILEALANI